MDKKAIAFFKDERINDYIDKQKTYNEESIINYYVSDYTSAFEKAEQQYDLLISQYTGFVSLACINWVVFSLLTTVTVMPV